MKEYLKYLQERKKLKIYIYFMWLLTPKIPQNPKWVVGTKGGKKTQL